jgi:PAS domain S-box-containing protein
MNSRKTNPLFSRSTNFTTHPIPLKLIDEKKYRPKSPVDNYFQQEMPVNHLAGRIPSKEINSRKQKNQLYKNIFQTISDGIIIIDISNGKIIDANSEACSLHGYTYEEFIGLHDSSIIHPDYLFLYSKGMESDQSGSSTRTTTTHVRKDGSLIFFDAGITTFIIDDRACLLVYLHELPENRDTKKFILLDPKKVEDKIHEQTTLLEISQTLSSTLDLDPELILEQLRKIISYTHAAIFSKQETTLTTLGVCGLSCLDRSPLFKINLGGLGVPKIFFNGHQTTRIPDIWNNDPEAVYLRTLFADEASIFLDGVQSWMWVPLVVKGRVLGGLGIAHEQLNYFSVHHSDLAQTVANQAAITMVNAELYEQSQMYATLQERQRLARNLHDAVNQSLFSASLIVDVLPRLFEKDPEKGRESLEDLQRLINGAMAEMRMTMAELRPLTLVEDDLSNLLKLQVDAFSGRANIPVHLSISGKNHMSSDVQVVLYRLCQESLNNIAKHSKASLVEITLLCQANSVKLTISDNGCGFDPSPKKAGHFGISIMQERAESIGAQFNIMSSLDHGTKIEIIWTDEPGRK